MNQRQPQSKSIPGKEAPKRSASRPQTAKRPMSDAGMLSQKTSEIRRVPQNVTGSHKRVMPTETPTMVIGVVPTVQKAPEKRGLLSLYRTNEPKVRTIRAKKRKPFPFASVFVMMCCCMLFMYMVFNYVQINEYTIHLSEMQADLNELNKTQQSLSLQLEKRNNLSEIAEIAENELGMVKMDEIQKEYLDGRSDDSISVSDAANTQKTEIGSLSDLMSTILQNFKDLAEYIR